MTGENDSLSPHTTSVDHYIPSVIGRLHYRLVRLKPYAPLLPM